MTEPVIFESSEVQLQAYIQVVDDFCKDLAGELNVPRNLVQRREMVEFYSVLLAAI